MVGRAHDADDERSSGVSSAPKTSVPSDLALRRRRGGRGDRRPCRRAAAARDLGRARVHHGRDDLAVAGAAARTPPSPSITCCSVGVGVTRRRAAAETSMPGVQMPALRRAVLQERSLQSAAFAARVAAPRASRPADPRGVPPGSCTRSPAHRRGAPCTRRSRPRRNRPSSRSTPGRRAGTSLSRRADRVRSHRRSVHVERDGAHRGSPQLVERPAHELGRPPAGSRPSRGRRRSG